jgi:uncharacterized membrane protein YphA (DoxX/SURF4 family)
MAGLPYACALVLAAVLVWAGAAKLARPATTAASFEALGVPAPRALARAVPVAELALSAALLAAPRPGAAASLAVLAAFTAVLARALARGTTAGCACFGSPSAEPVSASDLVRNGLLAALALTALAAPPTDPSLPSPAAATVVLVATAAGAALVRVSRGRRRPGGPAR